MYLNFDWVGSFPLDSGRVYPVGKTIMIRYKIWTDCFWSAWSLFRGYSQTCFAGWTELVGLGLVH